MERQSVKSAVLRALEENRGKFLSGEELAQKISCSRGAVWKAVQGLREEGYQISAVRNRGYALREENDILSREAVLQKFSGRRYPVYTYKELPSTNDRMKELLLREEYLPSGTAVVAEEQTRGRGRNGRIFPSPRGTGLYLSILLRREDLGTCRLALCAAAAEAVYHGVREILGVELGIQWIDDLYYRDSKVGGIFTEAMTGLETGEMELAIVGIGIRLYDCGYGGIYSDRSVQVDRNALVARIVEKLLENPASARVSEAYRSRNLAVGTWRTLRWEGRQERVFVKEILPDGRLRVQPETGEEEKISFGELI